MSLFRRLLGHHCPLCLTRANSYICQGCFDDLPQISHSCLICGLPLALNTSNCVDCIKHPKPYTLTISPLLYSHPVDYLIRQFKERTPNTIAHDLAPFLQPLIEQRYNAVNWPDILMPIPLHWQSQFKRGFNQAHCLADVLSSMTGIACSAVATRHKGKANQKSLDRNQRLLNLRRIFECKEDISGMHVVIVDDVITTCATVINMANILLAAGASRVDVWALARTPLKSNEGVG